MSQVYTTLIIDDEPLARTRLEKLLSVFPESINVIGHAKNGNEALKKIKQLTPDLIFLDIEMPGLTGFQLLEHLETMPLIVFCTAHDEYALQAFETNSIDYLIKPVRTERLEKTIKKLQQFNNAQSSENLLEVIKTISQKQASKKMTSITVKKGDSIIFIKLEDIFYFEASDKYVNIITNRQHHIIEKSLTQLEQQLPSNFMRVHRGVIVNTNYVAEIQKYFNSRFVIKLNNNKATQITSGRSYSETIKKWINV
jgi:two-component system LytT family response regulator